jgi:two-component system, NtrC family, sensor kinase
MRSTWSLRTQVTAITVAVVLPVLAVSTALTVRLFRGALEDDLRGGGLALARELAASAAGDPTAADDADLQREIGSVLGRGSVVRDAAAYTLTPNGLALRAWGGTLRPAGPEAEIAAREMQEVVARERAGGERLLRVTVPVVQDGRSVGVVSLGLALTRTDALVRQAERQALGLGVATLLLLVGGLSIFMNRALTRPVRQLVAVMGQAEGGDLAARAPEDRVDEVGDLGRGLNRMLARVASFQSELTRQVAAATAKLRAVNQRLFAAQQQIARSERLAAAGELAATMAHDVGTPMTAVSAHLQLLGESVAEPAIKERLALIQAQVERTVQGAKRFLDAARPQPTRVRVDVNALLEDLLFLISPELQRRGTALTKHLDPGLGSVTGDPGQLQELFLNLITNALEAMGQDGTLSLTTRTVRGEMDRAAARITVADTGPGMAPEVLARAFDAFFTTHQGTGGTGLGLAICRRIAREHGGQIHLESEPGRGTRVSVELPLDLGG